MKRYTFALALSVGAVSAVNAADLPARAPAPPPIYVPPVYNWTGFYLGGNLGAGFSNISLTDTNNNTFSSSLSGAFLGGGQAGVNYEFGGGVVIGAEAMFDWISVTKNTITALNGASTASVTINDRWLMLATGRLGYAWDRVLVYAKGGGVFVGADTPSLTVTSAGATSAAPLSGPSSTWGWTAGAGAEWAFYGNWSARAELDYIRLVSQTFTTPATAPFPVTGDSITFNGSNTVNVMFTAGLNYKFGPW
jgi:outer membrane immunogenic protein